ncbi:MAG: type II secretion system F family protein [Planctomycetales bacterium]|nr:type II secretion system F family protein [Planctomycetales bacterium]
MPDFAYVARNLQGKRVTGTISANTQREAISLLSGKSLFPLQVDAAKSASSAWSLGKKKVAAQQLATFYAQLAGLLRSGVPLLRSLEVLRKQSSSPVLSEILGDVHHRIEEGATLADAMHQHRSSFGELSVSLIRAGGEGGFLEDSLERIAQFTEEQEDFKSRTMGALAYPMFLAVVGTVVVFGLIVFFVPNFAEIFDDMRERGELPLITDLLLNFSTSLRKYGLIVVVALGFLIAYLKTQLATEKGRRKADAFKLKIPMLGPVFKSLAVARFCRVLGTLLHNGVPILRSLEISRDAAGNRILSESIEEASENISSGDALATPLAASGHFPTTVVEMIAVAEESNSLDSVLVDIADGLERRTARRLELVVRLLEPVMLLILAVIVLIVVIALLLPIFKMSSTVG